LYDCRTVHHYVLFSIRLFNVHDEIIVIAATIHSLTLFSQTQGYGVNAILLSNFTRLNENIRFAARLADLILISIPEYCIVNLR